MTQEDKELLLKDLCARLPYGIKVGTTDNDDSLENVWDIYILFNNTFDINVKLTHCFEDDDKLIDISEVKPYLFPLSSMTEEQKEEYVSLQQRVIYNGQVLVNLDVMKYVDWCYKNHIDINSLIPMNLAIDATELNIYYRRNRL